MRVMVIVKASSQSEAGARATEQELEEMGAFNAELLEAGILLAGEGLHPSCAGKRVRFSNGQRTVIDGPFGDPGQLVGGFWLWKVQSLDEAVRWVQRAPFDSGTEVEIRPILEPEDFTAVDPTGELR